ncbi:DeoR/GlpR family DNA-binding transcription regulator [Alteribacillus sp. HJP-4]|uniref:DeoR/GlpR family DNA-binding transcription regulator n=1 Tax=Alteribacillus sp. HJP-4 TaxID=2775394 RepID=UPI0035CCFF55
MNGHERREHIARLLKDEGKMDIDKLTQEFNVSTMTIRRDLTQLEKEGKLLRTFGGAVLPHTDKGETPYLQKESENTAQKRMIAKKAAELIKENSTIILDSGTTTLELARCLRDKDGITIVTNDILIAAELVHTPVQVIVTGGELQRGVGAMFGSHTQQLLSSLHVDYFFLGAHAVDRKGGVTAPTFEKAKIKQLMISAAAETWLIADASKFDTVSFAHVCALDRVHGIITDRRLSNADQAEPSYHDNILYAAAERRQTDENWNHRR